MNSEQRSTLLFTYFHLSGRVSQNDKCCQLYNGSGPLNSTRRHGYFLNSTCDMGTPPPPHPDPLYKQYRSIWNGPTIQETEHDNSILLSTIIRNTGRDSPGDLIRNTGRDSPGDCQGNLDGTSLCHLPTLDPIIKRRLIVWKCIKTSPPAFLALFLSVHPR